MRRINPILTGIPDRGQARKGQKPGVSGRLLLTTRFPLRHQRQQLSVKLAEGFPLLAVALMAHRIWLMLLFQR